jgi:hypothetical protein
VIVRDVALKIEWGTKKERITLSRKLRKLIQETLSNPNSAEIFEETRQKYRAKEKGTISTMNALMRLADISGTNEYEKSALSLAIYLFLTEGSIASYMNFICFMLVSQGHDIYDFFSKKYACSFEEIANVDMRTKEEFLKEHDFDLFNKGYDRKLRNAVAHRNFDIEDDGTIRVKGAKIDVFRKLQQGYDFMSFLHATTASAMQKFVNH